MMVEENENLAFSFPREGFNLFIDAMCIPKGCQNKAAAEAYINFLCDPEICAQNLEYLGYSAPSQAARTQMDPEVANDPVAYPSEDILALGQSFSHLPAVVSQELDSLFLEVKTGNLRLSVDAGDGGMHPLVYVCVGVVLGVLGSFLFFTSPKRKWNRRRSRK